MGFRVNFVNGRILLLMSCVVLVVSICQFCVVFFVFLYPNSCLLNKLIMLEYCFTFARVNFKDLSVCRHKAM